MSKTARSDALHAARRAVSRIRSYGIDGPSPIEEIEALAAFREAEVEAALQGALREASGNDLPAAIHLVQLLRCSAVLDTVHEVAFAAPSGVEAKREALDTLRRCGVEPDADAVEKVAVIDAMADDPDTQALVTLLEWPAVWREPALEAWLAAAGEEQLAAVEIALGVQHELDARLLDWIASQGSQQAAEVLQRFLAAADGSDARDKERIKQVRKALHRLRSQGVEIDDSTPASEAGGFSLALAESALQDARAYLTSIDGSGARLVWVLWRAASGGSRLLQAVVDDSTGVREAEIATVTRQGFRDYVEQMRGNPTVLLQQVPLPDAVAVLSTAAAHTERTGGELPAAYLKWAGLAGVSAADTAAPPIYQYIDAAEVRDNEPLIEEAMKLLREPHFQSWALEGEHIDAAAEQIHQAETSTLMVNDEQRKERMQDAMRDAVQQTFDRDTRARYRGRLEAMAQMLWERGERDAARQTLAAAVGLTEIEDLFRRHAFARALAHRGVWLAYQDKQRELTAERQRSGIIQP